AEQEAEPEPERAARPPGPVPGFEVEAVEPLQAPLELDRAADEVRRDRQPLEVAGRERRPASGGRERPVGVRPRATLVRGAAALEGAGRPPAPRRRRPIAGGPPRPRQRGPSVGGPGASWQGRATPGTRGRGGAGVDTRAPSAAPAHARAGKAPGARPFRAAAPARRRDRSRWRGWRGTP